MSVNVFKSSNVYGTLKVKNLMDSSNTTLVSASATELDGTLTVGALATLNHGLTVTAEESLFQGEVHCEQMVTVVGLLRAQDDLWITGDVAGVNADWVGTSEFVDVAISGTCGMNELTTLGLVTVGANLVVTGHIEGEWQPQAIPSTAAAVGWTQLTSLDSLQSLTTNVTWVWSDAEYTFPSAGIYLVQFQASLCSVNASGDTTTLTAYRISARQYADGGTQLRTTDTKWTGSLVTTTIGTIPLVTEQVSFVCTAAVDGYVRFEVRTTWTATGTGAIQVNRGAAQDTWAQITRIG